MKQKYILLVLLVIIISTTSISVLAVTPNIELTPPTQSVNQGTQATIEVVVEDVTDLKGANIILNFDASKLQYNSSTDGGFIPGAILIEGTIDNTNGSVTLDIASIISNASGTGTIMSVTFDTIGAGDGSITFGTTTLRDKDNLIIDHTIGSGCLVTVNAKLTEIVVLPEIMDLFVGEDRTITSITASYNYGPDKTIALADCSYDSDNENVATVAAGVVTAVGAGTATITVTYSEGGITKTDTLEVTVNPIELTSIVVLPETMNLLKGDSGTIISITAHYNNGNTASIVLADCSYSSDNESIATVATGVITAVGVGTATITVSYTEGGITKTDIVVVTVIPVPNLELTPPSQSVITGNPVVINILVENVTNLKGTSITLNFEASKLQYNSSTDGGFIPSAILIEGTIDNTNGTVILNLASLTSYVSGTGTIITVTFNTIEAGDTTITFGTTTLRDKNNYDIDHTAGNGCMVTVNPIQLTSIAVLPETMNLFKGDSDTIISITAYYNNGDTASIALADCTYESDDTAVATVNTTGEIAAVNVGTAIITITYSERGITQIDEVEVMVNAKLTEIVVLSETMTLFEGGETDSIASIIAHYNNGDTANIALGDCTYSSDNENVATVAVGVVTTVDPGTATITVTYIEGGITKTDTLMVTVNPIQLTSIAVLPETMTLFKGNSETITSIIAHYNNGDTVNVALGNCTYNSDTTAVATVNTSGEITAIDVGTTTITVTYSEGGITKTDIIEIIVIPVPNLKLNPPSQSVGVSDFGTVNVVVEDATDLRGANISLNFDASKLQYSSSSSGDFIPNDTLQVTSIDNTKGSVTLDIAGLGTSGYHSGTGTGTIIIVVFERIAISNTNITFGTTQLRDKDNNSINHTAGSGCLFTNLLGDFGGPDGYPDCIVDFEDLMIFAMAYGSTPSDANWNPVCDIAGPDGPTPDGVIDFEDLMVFAMHYGETCADL